MEKKPQPHASRRPPQRGILLDLGRILFPDLIHHPRALRARMTFLTLSLAAMLVGALIGFYRYAHEPAWQIQARELNR